MQTPVYKLKTKRQQITLANKAIQEGTRNGVTDGQSVIICITMHVVLLTVMEHAV